MEDAFTKQDLVEVPLAAEGQHVRVPLAGIIAVLEKLLTREDGSHVHGFVLPDGTEVQVTISRGGTRVPGGSIPPIAPGSRAQAESEPLG